MHCIGMSLTTRVIRRESKPTPLPVPPQRWSSRYEHLTSATRNLLRSLFVIMALTVPISAGVAVAEVPGMNLVFLSRAEYLTRWGTPAGVGIAPRSAGTVEVAWPVREKQSDWSAILWDESDLRGVSTPVRIGNEADLGWEHYAGRHNLTSRTPIHAAFQTHKPDKDLGARQEYISYAVDPKGRIHITIRVIVQAATRTDDRRYATSDGKNIGVITAYCEGYDRCPDWVNKA